MSQPAAAGAARASNSSWARSPRIAATILVLAAALGCAGEAGAAKAPADIATAPADTSSSGEAALTTFPNGLRLLVLPRPDEALARIDVYVEPVRIAAPPGLVHLCEHLLFASSLGAPHGSLRDSLLLNGGTFNASTSLQGLHMHGTCLPWRLGPALALEAERLGRLRPEPEDLERERRRVLGEHDLRHGILPAQSLALRIMSMAYGVGPGGGDPLLGNPEDIRSITMDDVDRFLAAGLRPERTCVLVSGPIDPDEVAALAAGSLGQVAATGPPPSPEPLPPPGTAREPWTQDIDSESDLLAVGFRLPCGSERELALAHLASAIMTRESGDPTLYFHGEEALLTLCLTGDWTRTGEAQAGVARAEEQFWDGTRRVLLNVADEWMFERNRRAGVARFRELASKPLDRARWRAQRLASGRFTPEPDSLAAIMDSIPQAVVAGYFAQNFTREKASVAMAVARPSLDPWRALIGRFRRLETNPYLDDQRGAAGLGAARIEPLLAAVAGHDLPPVATVALAGGRLLHTVEMGDGAVHAGAARSFAPGPDDPDRRRQCERLEALQVLAGLGYGSGGAAVQPRGFDPGSGTSLELTPGSLIVTALGLGSDLAQVAADFCKRLRTSSLDPELLWYIQKSSPEWLDKYDAVPGLHAARACLERTFGRDASLAGWRLPGAASIASWKVGDAEKALARMSEGDSLAFVVVGDIGGQDVAAIIERSSAGIGHGRSGGKPAGLPAVRGSGAGCVVHQAGPEVASVLFLGGGCEPAASEGLTIDDLAVLAQVLEARILGAGAAAGVDSLAVDVILEVVGPLTLPWVRAGAPTGRIPEVVALVRDQMEQLALRPLDADEEARARLALLGPQLEALSGPAGMFAHLLATAVRGPVPANPLAPLCRLRTGLLAERAPRLFAPHTGAHVVVGDTTTVAIGALLRELGPE